MGKLYKQPYKNKKYAEDYNYYWVHQEDIKPSVDLEIELVKNLVQGKKSWCDVACGTGYHLQNVNSKVKKVGVDKSKHMLDYAKLSDKSNITYHQKDLVKGVDGLGSYDLVTAFGYGYSHQKTLTDVLKFIKNLANLANKGGDVLIGYDGVPNFCNTLGWHNGLGELKVKAVITDYYQESGTDYIDCISPTKETIIESIYDDFESVEIIKLPVSWKNTLLHFRDKK